MDIATTIEATSAAVVGLSLLAGGVFAAGKFKGVMDANTSAVEKLAGVFERFSNETDRTLLDHEVRIAVLEKTPRIDDRPFKR